MMNVENNFFIRRRNELYKKLVEQHNLVPESVEELLRRGIATEDPEWGTTYCNQLNNYYNSLAN